VWITTGGGYSEVFYVANSQVVERLSSQRGLQKFAYRGLDKTLWLGLDSGLWHLVGSKWVRLDLPKEIADKVHFLQTITEDRRGAMWVSFGRHGLYRLADGVWTSYGGREDLPKTGMLLEFTDNLGRVWFGYRQTPWLCWMATGCRCLDQTMTSAWLPSPRFMDAGQRNGHGHQRRVVGQGRHRRVRGPTRVLPNTLVFDAVHRCCARCVVPRLPTATQTGGPEIPSTNGRANRIARELHDTLLQSFQGLLLRLQSVSNVLPKLPANDEAKDRLNRVIDQAAQAVTEGPDAVQGLHPQCSDVNRNANQPTSEKRFNLRKGRSPSLTQRRVIMPSSGLLVASFHFGRGLAVGIECRGAATNRH
jgi:hypothetical protein